MVEKKISITFEEDSLICNVHNVSSLDVIFAVEALKDKVEKNAGYPYEIAAMVAMQKYRKDHASEFADKGEAPEPAFEV